MGGLALSQRLPALTPQALVWGGDNDVLVIAPLLEPVSLCTHSL